MGVDVYPTSVRVMVRVRVSVRVSGLGFGLGFRVSVDVYPASVTIVYKNQYVKAMLLLRIGGIG